VFGAHRGTVLVGVVVGGALLVSGCGPGAPAASVARLPTTTTAGSAKGQGDNKSSGNDNQLAYARCMRAHGVPDFPDPNSQRGFTLQGGQEGDLGPDSPAFQQANEDCQQLTPVSGVGHGPTPAQIAQAQAQALKFSQCMRSHGLADFPDPEFHAGGEGISISIKGGPGSDLDPSSRTFQAAQQACQKVQLGPKGAPHFATHGPVGAGSSSGGRRVLPGFVRASLRERLGAPGGEHRDHDDAAQGRRGVGQRSRNAWSGRQ
jgi:hypothetical protein